ncbi:excalibur calcium-binding domain-containing protein [Corynebacterium oculi]|uniref:excalibur calcium-binding domain-containing protein n=1 Tax=Corynebacterium oculi TaxID=1544416 RepID=UPI0009ECA9B1|nr:excalibur calcium-binding domain-containing protein [Corynebacterium oculi]
MSRVTQLHAFTVIVGSALLATACGSTDGETEPTAQSATSTTTTASSTSTTSATSTTPASTEPLDASASAAAGQAAEASREPQAQEPSSATPAASVGASPTGTGQQGNGATNNTTQASAQGQDNGASHGAGAQDSNATAASGGTSGQQGQSEGDAQQGTPGPSVYDPNPGDAQDTPVGQLYYSNCGQALTDGALPLHRGEPGYREALDRDGDGIACEPENWPEHEAWPTPTKLPQAYSGEEIQRLMNDPNIDYEPDPGVPGPPPQL